MKPKKKTRKSNVERAIDLFSKQQTWSVEDLKSALSCRTSVPMIIHQCREQGHNIQSVVSGKRVLAYRYVYKPKVCETQKSSRFEDLGWEESFDPVSLRDLGL